MKRYILVLIIYSTCCYSQIPVGYYNSATGLTKNALKVALHNIIKNHTQISYNSLWNAYKKTDVKTNGKVWDIYSSVATGTPPYEFTFTTDQCGNYAVESDCYNREHSWPQSWFNSVTGPVSDMFHIYPTDGKVNGVRSNYPYGNVTAATWTSLNGGKLGPCTNVGYASTVFEPIDEFKGDLARGYFYMSTRYYTEDAGWSTSAATNKSEILPWQLTVLLQWSKQDPVSAKEIARNDSIYYKYQNNRNPFIDNPNWADSIWTVSTTLVVDEFEFPHSFSIFPNPAQDVFSILNKSNSIKLEALLKVTSIAGEMIEEREISLTESLTVDCHLWARGIYFINLSSKEGNSNLKFIKQ